MSNFTVNFNDKLSQLALGMIDEHPELWKQDSYSYPRSCGTAYCYMGWCQNILGNWDITRPQHIFPETIEAIGLHHTYDEDDDYWEFTDSNNSLAKLKALHAFHVTGIFGIDGRDSDGYGRDNLDLNGFDKDGYDIDSFNINGYNCYGLTEKDIF